MAANGAAAASPAPRPLVIGFVNRLSGGQLGAQVHAAVQQLGLDTVHDLSTGGPRQVLSDLLHRPDPSRPVLVLCFGGDGTFNWLASTVLALRESEEKLPPGSDNFHLVPCPLGTGNDLARSLGWGHKFPGMNRLPAFVDAARKAALGYQLDIWRIHFAHTAAKLRRMQNYFSIGVDAEVARRFDAARTARPEQFRSAVKNKMTYARLGLDLLVRGARSLEHRIEVLSIDGVAVKVPHGCKSIVFLNIPSFGAGTHPWGDGGDDGGDSACLPLAHRKRSFAKPAVDDGLLEVVALFGILDAARMHIPLTLASLRGYGARRLGQGRAVEVTFRSEEQYKQFHPARKDPGARPGRGTLSAQVDGEAWPFPCWEESVSVTLQGKVGAPCGPEHSPRGGWPSARHADGNGNTVRISTTAATDGVKHGENAAFDSGPPSSRNFSTPEGRLREPVMA